MAHIEMRSPTYRLVVVPLPPIEDEAPEFSAILCEECGASRILYRWVVEVQPFLSNTHNNYLLVEKEVCIECDNIPEVVMYESADQVRMLYGQAK